MSKNKEYQCMFCNKNKVFCTVASNGDGEGESGFGSYRPVCKDLECQETARKTFTEPEKIQREIEELERKKARIEEQTQEILTHMKTGRSLSELYANWELAISDWPEEIKELCREYERSIKKKELGELKNTRNEINDQEERLSNSSYCANCSRLGAMFYHTKRNDHYKFCSVSCGQEYYQKWTCQECSKLIESKYLKNENDGKKFCSEKCFDYHYALNCDDCQQKCLGDTYSNQSGTICSNCYQKRQEQEKARKLAESQTEKKKENEKPHTHKNFLLRQLEV